MAEWRMAQPVDFTLDTGEHIAIVGPNASGKTMLAEIITGAHPLTDQRVEYDFCMPGDEHEGRSTLASDNIKYLAFRDMYGGSTDRTYYLQQRWNQTEIDDDMPIVGNVLETVFLRTGPDTEERRAFQDHLYDLFQLRSLLDKAVIFLSSGELRKFTLCKALMSRPRVLIMDNPFIGLDKATRQQVRQLLATLSTERGLQVILVLSKEQDIPTFITHVVPVRDKVVLPKMPREEFLRTCPPLTTMAPAIEIPVTSTTEAAMASQEVVALHKVSIRYGERTILKDLDWTVRCGERWALTGQNGSGKSTLLSLVCADNPQSYACDITLFGHKRGTGESIWDIKRHIGYVSPEMHRAYNRDMPAIRIVASGLKDTVGLHVQPSEDDYTICRQWMHTFGIHTLADRSFMRLSSGEQRMVLLARAFVKNPDLLILDEPFHGLDNTRTQHVKTIIEAFCQQPAKTLIMVSHYAEDLPACITHTLQLTKN